MLRNSTILLLFLLFLSPSLNATGFSSPNVPINDPVYRDIDKLVAAGLAPDVIYGQRPWSRSEIARIIGESIGRNEAPTAVPIEALKREYRAELIEQGYLEGGVRSFQFHPLSRLEVSHTYLNSPYRSIFENNGIGRVDAQFNPLVSYNDGREFVDGYTFSLETYHWLKLSEYFSLDFRPDVRFLQPRGGDIDTNPFVQNLSGKFLYRNLSIEVGRDALVWGQGQHGGHMFTNNARPLDMIKISNDSPFYHPWLFKYLGPSSYTFFVANMGPEREFPYTYLTGWKATFKPWSFFEFGGSNIFYIGGEGAPGIEWYDPALETVFARIGKNTRNVADHRVGAEFRLFVPFLKNAQVYGEMAFEDFSANLFLLNDASYFEDRTAYQFGIYAPLVDTKGNVSLRLEYEHIPPLFNRHATWISGHTLNRKLLGSSLGPDGDKVYVAADYQLRCSSELTLNLQAQWIDNDMVSKITSASGNADFVTIGNGIIEKRYRLGIHWKEQVWGWLSIMVGTDYEKVIDFNFIEGNSRNNLKVFAKASLSSLWN